MQKFVRLTSFSIAATFLAGVALADPIADRQAAMKANGASVGILVKMAKGEEAYDAAKAKGAIDALLKTANSYGDMFPAGSDKGDTKANEKVWSDAAGFKAELAKFKAAVEASAAGATKDVDGVKAALGAIGATCKSCHDGYRKS